jgi:hypothetical protein
MVIAALAAAAAAEVSLANSLMFDTPLTASATNPSGQTVAVSGSTVYSISAAGSVVFARSFPGITFRVAAVDANGLAYAAGDYNCTSGSCVTPTTVFHGTAQPTSQVGPAVVRLNADGSTVYVAAFFGANPATITGMSAHPAGHTQLVGTAVCGWPTTAGSLQPSCTSGELGFVMQLSATGQSLLWSTYLDAPGGGSRPQAVVFDDFGNLAVTGRAAVGFPTTAGAFAQSGTGGDGFVAKIRPGGDALLYSTLLPGGVGAAIASDGAGNAYVAGTTAGSLPVTPGAAGASFVADNAGSLGQFAAKLNPTGSALVYATYLGIAQQNLNAPTSLPSTRLGIAVDSAGNAYIAGTTTHAGGPVANAVQNVIGDGAVAGATTKGDGYLVELNPTGTQYLISSYFGGREGDGITGIGLGSDGAVYCAGATRLNEFPFTVQAGAGATGAAGFYTKFTAGGVAVPVLFPVDGPPDVRASNVGELFFGTSNSGAPITRRFHLGNYGALPLTIASVAGSGDFSAQSACPATLPAGDGCDITVTFQPTLNGARSGTLTANTGSARGLPTNRLLATAVAPTVGLSTRTLGFGVVATGSTSAPQTLTVTNTGDTPLVISAVTIVGDYAQTNNCVASLAPAATCQVSVTFTPHTDGELDGTLFLTDNAFDSPQRILLVGGVAPDFTFNLGAGNTGLDSVTAGTTASYGVRIASTGGFAGNVTFTCSGAPANATCSLNPPSATLVQSGAINVIVSVSTTAHTTTSRLGTAPWMFFAAGVPLLWLARRKRRLLRGSLLLLGVSALLVLPSCGGDKKKTTDNTQTGTPAGTYTLTVTATSGSTSHTQSLVLLVQ